VKGTPSIKRGGSALKTGRSPLIQQFRTVRPAQRKVKTGGDEGRIEGGSHEKGINLREELQVGHNSQRTPSSSIWW